VKTTKNYPEPPMQALHASPENTHAIAVSLDGVMVGMKPEKKWIVSLSTKKTEW
jgi:hypothetical protein